MGETALTGGTEGSATGQKESPHFGILKKKKERKTSSSQPFQLRDSACSLPSLLLDLCDKHSVFFCYQ